MWPGKLSARQKQGQEAEQRALEHLRRQGLVHIESNFHCSCGEIDLVMRDGSQLVFVEVRKRGNPAWGGAAGSIGPAKRRRMINAAQVYLKRFPRVPAARIDVVAIDGTRLEWLVDAVQTS